MTIMYNSAQAYKDKLKNKLLSRMYQDTHNFDGCWLYTGCLCDGYGLMSAYGKLTRVSRIAMHIYKDFDLTSKQLILHKCKSRKCFNPDHLYVGTQLQNHRDRVRDNVKTHCSKGHEMTLENTYTNRGKRHCALCRRINNYNRYTNHRIKIDT